MKTTLLQVDGLWCGGCARALEKKLSTILGVESITVNLESSSAQLKFEPALTVLDNILEQARSLGYEMKVTDWTGRVGEEHLERTILDLSLRLAVGVFLSMWVMLCTVPTYSLAQSLQLFPHLEADAVRGMGFAALALSSVVVLYCGAPFHRMSWRWLRVKMTGTDQLVSLGALLSWVFSAVLWWRGETELYCDGACLLVVLLLVARLLEHNARLRSRRALSHLLRQAPEVYVDLKGQAQPLSTAKVGRTRFLVETGGRVPLDGVVEEGGGWCDARLLSGESMPGRVCKGDPIYAGTRITAGTVQVICTETPGLRRLDRLALAMRAARAQQGSLAGFSERAARGVGALLIFSAGLVLLTGIGDPWGAVQRALALLVVGCPCALTLAVPLVVRTVTQRAAASGVSFAGGEALERLSELDTFVFDKTGTLSLGEPGVTEVKVHTPEVSASDCLSLAASLSHGNPHPLSQAFRHAAPASSAIVPLSEVVKVLPGEGLATEKLLLGSSDLLRRRGVRLPTGLTGTCHLARDGALIASFHISDPLDSSALQVVALLQQSGCDVSVASGDRVEALQPLLVSGIRWRRVEGELSPEDKVDRVSEQTVFVGDGINDALALTRAGVGVAVGPSTPTAIEAADLHLSSTALLTLAREWSKLARRRMKLALLMSAAYNVVLIPGAVIGWVTPGWAALAMGLSSISVVAVASTTGVNSPER